MLPQIEQKMESREYAWPSMKLVSCMTGGSYNDCAVEADLVDQENDSEKNNNFVNDVAAVLPRTI